MTQLPFLCRDQVRCGVCRKVTPAARLTQRGSLRICATCARPRVIGEDEMLRRLLNGKELTAAAGQVRRWFSC